MIPKSGYRFSKKIMLKQQPKRNGNLTNPVSLLRSRPQLYFQSRGNRHVVRWPRGTAISLGNVDAGDAVGEHWRGPDVIEAAALIGGRPIRRTITPPSVELGRFRGELAHAVDPVSGFLRARQLFAFDRRVRDDAKHLFVAPHIMLQRRDIEVADQDRTLGALRTQSRAVAHFIEKAELMSEFRVDVGIGNIAARGHVEVMYSDGIAQTGALA